MLLLLSPYSLKSQWTTRLVYNLYYIGDQPWSRWIQLPSTVRANGHATSEKKLSKHITCLSLRTVWAVRKQNLEARDAPALTAMEHVETQLQLDTLYSYPHSGQATLWAVA